MTASYFSKAYRRDRPNAWHLSIWTGPAMKAWCVQDTRTDACVGLAVAGSEKLPEFDRLPAHPASASFIAVPEISALVPEGVLHEGGGAAHLELVHGPLPAGRLREMTLNALSARCIYQHDEAAEGAVLKSFPSARPLALHALLINAAVARAGERPMLLLHRTDKRCDLVIVSNRIVRLANSFPAGGSTDLLYFALFALDRTGLGPSDVFLRTCGMALSGEDQSLLARYFPNSSPAITMNETTIAGLGIERPERFIALLDQRSCVS